MKHSYLQLVLLRLVTRAWVEEVDGESLEKAVSTCTSKTIAQSLAGGIECSSQTSAVHTFATPDRVLSS